MNYNIQDYNISGEIISEDIIKKIITYHIEPLEDVFICSGIIAYPSLKSCYRSIEWEQSRGRSGRSQHCFIGLGACDVTCNDFKENKEDLLESLIDNTPYLRFAVYEGFIHCDYKNTNVGKRLLFESNASSKWSFKKFV